MITGFGRLGEWFGSAKYDIRPDLITSAKGLSSAYAAIGAVIATDKVFEPFLGAQSMYTHGITFGGHPVQCAIALKNIEIMKRERIVENVRDNGDAFRDTLAQLLDLDIVGDLRGTGYFYALELVKDKETRDGFSDEDSETLLRGFLSPTLFERGLICRADDRGDPVVQISPPLIATQAEFDEMTGILGDVLTEAQERMHMQVARARGEPRRASRERGFLESPRRWHRGRRLGRRPHCGAPRFLRANRLLRSRPGASAGAGRPARGRALRRGAARRVRRCGDRRARARGALRRDPRTRPTRASTRRSSRRRSTRAARTSTWR